MCERLGRGTPTPRIQGGDYTGVVLYITHILSTAFYWRADASREVSVLSLNCGVLIESGMTINSVTVETRDQYCCYCGEQEGLLPPARFTAEHLVPLSKGGSNSPANKRKCCRRCNQERGNMSLEMFHAVILEKLAVSPRGSSAAYRYEAMEVNVLTWIEYVATSKNLSRRDNSRNT